LGFHKNIDCFRLFKRMQLSGEFTKFLVDSDFTNNKSFLIL